MSLRAEAVRFRYGNGPEVLAGVDLELAAGELVGIIGPNGAGKSTVLSLLTGAAAPNAGQVRLEERPLRAWGRRALARRLAVVSQRPELPAGFRVHDVVMMGRAPHLGFLATERPEDHRVVEAALRRTGVWQHRDAFVEALSGGEAQRVVLARALAQRPAYLLLDEPTHHLDLKHAVEVMRHVERLAREDGLGVAAVLHDLNLAARCARIVVLAAGGVAADGPPGEVLQAPLLERVYGTEVAVLPGPPRVVVAR